MCAIEGIHNDALGLCKNNAHNTVQDFAIYPQIILLKTSYPQVIQL